MSILRPLKIISLLSILATWASISPNAQTAADTLAENYGDSASCTVNVACEDGRPWFNEIRSTVRFVSSPFPKTEFDRVGCTGTLINNTNEDRTVYMLTAAHCAGGEIGTFRNFYYQFYWQTSTCTNPVAAPNFTYVHTAAELVTEGQETGSEDYALQRLVGNIDSIDVHFAGWSIEDVAPEIGVIIGHPEGDVKKIIIDEDAPTWGASTWSVSTEVGFAQRGSSGSALLNEDHEIVGNARSAGGSCPPPTTVSGPKFEFYWDLVVDTLGTSLDDFLDEAGTGAQSILSIANYDLVVSGERFSDPTTDFAAGFFRTAFSITADDDTLASGGRLHLRAFEDISITGDFVADTGGELLVQIDPDPGAGGSLRAPGPLETFLSEVPAVSEQLLHPNYPNPFYHQTTFRFLIPEASHVSLKVYDILGREVVTLLDQHHDAGNVTFLWVAADEASRPLASGVYIYRLRVGDVVEIGRMTFLD